MLFLFPSFEDEAGLDEVGLDEYMQELAGDEPVTCTVTPAPTWEEQVAEFVLDFERREKFLRENQVNIP